MKPSGTENGGVQLFGKVFYLYKMKHFVFDFLYFCIFELFSFVVRVETKYICCVQDMFVKLKT